MRYIFLFHYEARSHKQFLKVKRVQKNILFSYSLNCLHNNFIDGLEKYDGRRSHDILDSALFHSECVACW